VNGNKVESTSRGIRVHDISNFGSRECLIGAIVEENGVASLVEARMVEDGEEIENRVLSDLVWPKFAGN
jgi:hypothetical protein